MRRIKELLIPSALLFLLSCSGGQKAHEEAAAPHLEPPADMAAEAPRSPEGRGPTGGKPRMLGTMAYECEDSTFVVAQLDDATGGLWLFLPEETVLLPHVPSASGAHYSNGVVSLWSQGISATIETPAGSRRCAENRRRSVIEDAKLRGNDFWATGNEPGWNLEIGPEVTVLRTNYGQTIYSMRTPQPQTFAEARRTSYVGHARGVDSRLVDMRIVIEGSACHDTMSGESFESSVTVTVGEDTLYGCGLALH